jgi:hypothetical protein
MKSPASPASCRLSKSFTAERIVVFCTRGGLRVLSIFQCISLQSEGRCINGQINPLLYTPMKFVLQRSSCYPIPAIELLKMGSG